MTQLTRGLTIISADMPIKLMLLLLAFSFTRINIGHPSNLSSGLSTNSVHFDTYLLKTTTLIC